MCGAACIRSTESNPTIRPNHNRVSVEDAAAGICGYLVEAEVSGADVKKVVEVAKKGAALNAVYPGYRYVGLLEGDGSMGGSIEGFGDMGSLGCGSAH